MDFFNLPPLPASDDDPVFGSNAPLDFTAAVINVPGTGFQLAIGGSDQTFDPFASVTPEQFRELTEKLADFFQVSLTDAFPPQTPTTPIGDLELSDGEQPEDFGRVVKRGSKKSINNFLRKIPGWQEYFVRIYDAENDEWIVVELKR